MWNPLLPSSVTNSINRAYSLDLTMIPTDCIPLTLQTYEKKWRSQLRFWRRKTNWGCPRLKFFAIFEKKKKIGIHLWNRYRLYKKHSSDPNNVPKLFLNLSTKLIPPLLFQTSITCFLISLIFSEVRQMNSSYLVSIFFFLYLQNIGFNPDPESVVS